MSDKDKLAYLFWKMLWLTLIAYLMYRSCRHRVCPVQRPACASLTAAASGFFVHATGAHRRA